MERPQISCRILGVLDFIRVPLPAARTITAAGSTIAPADSVVLTTVVLLWDGMSRGGTSRWAAASRRFRL